MLKTFKTGWYVLYVRSCQEKKVHNLLIDSRFESFLPLIKTTRQWSDRKKIVFKPLFPSYIFVKINFPQDFYRVLDVEGVCAYIKFGKEYGHVTEADINRVKLLVNIEGIKDVKILDKKICVGEKYKIGDGPLLGLDCEVVRANNKSMVVVRIDSLRQNIVATLPRHFLNEFLTAI